MDKKEVLNLKVGDKVNVYGTICKITKLNWLNNNIEFDSDIYIGQFNLAEMIDDIFIVEEDNKHWTDRSDGMLRHKVLSDKVQTFVNSQKELRDKEKLQEKVIENFNQYTKNGNIINKEKQNQNDVNDLKEYIKSGAINYANNQIEKLESELCKKDIEILNLKNQLKYFTNGISSSFIIQGELAGIGIMEQIQQVDRRTKVQDMYITNMNNNVTNVNTDTISELNKKKNSFLNI